jgi:ribosomal protein L40E
MIEQENPAEKLLVDGETLILADSIGADRLALTSKRLFIYGTKGFSGWANLNYVLKEQVKLEDIDSAIGDFEDSGFGVVGNSWLIIKLKVGKKWRCHFNSDSMSIFSFNTAQMLSMTKVNSWVSAINLELSKRNQNEFKVCECGHKNPPQAKFCNSCGKPL